LKEGTPLIIAPAMDEEMWLQPAVQENVQWLRSKGVGVIDPISGTLASGLSGMGRMLEPVELVEAFEKLFSREQRPSNKENSFTKTSLTGKNILITAGPTYEPIDPVRFIGNRSSGKMGAALADTARNDFGANVTLVMGPSHVVSSPLVNRIDVETTEEMRSAVLEQLSGHDVIIMNAAVSDYRIKNYSHGKLKKQTDGSAMHLDLEATADILQEIAKYKEPSQIIIGFALESSERGEEYARKKLSAKSLDAIVLNHFDEEGSGFSGDTNRVTIFTKNGMKREFPNMSKAQCAQEILSLISELINV
jgi:phosphopantothenoylcysteine decarboxylase/phosphopantothenate--cysteine ligase